MNKDRTGAVSTANALKMAIEALQNNQTYDWKGNPLTALDEANEKVINACKEALDTKQVCENAAPAQEPVAWMLPNENLVNYKDVAEFLCEEGQTPIPLYTHPVQNGASPLEATTLRTPLSDDEIQKTWYNLYPLDENNLWTDMLEGEHLRKFARAIEKAHGIV